MSKAYFLVQKTCLVRPALEQMALRNLRSGALSSEHVGICSNAGKNNCPILFHS
jgi:hypothetical protein